MKRRDFIIGTAAVSVAAAIPLPAIAESKYLTITFADMKMKAYELMKVGFNGLFHGKNWQYAATEAYKAEAMKQGKLLQLIVPHKYWLGIQSYSPYFVPDRIVIAMDDGTYHVVKGRVI